jgi:hypothetical protein
VTISSSFARRSGVNVNGGPFLDDPALRLLEVLGVVHHQRMKAHRSTSPMTTSVEPMTAMTSAIMPPMIAFGSAWQA